MNVDAAIHMINMAIEYILIAIFLAACISVTAVRNDYAEAINDKAALVSNTKTNLEFGGYASGHNQNNKAECMAGNQVIETLRKYREGTIRVYVDRDGDVNTTDDAILLNAETAKNSTDFTVYNLTPKIAETDYYHPYLIYDNDEMTTLDSTGLEITGITFIKYTGG